MIVKLQMDIFKLFWVLSRPTLPNYILNLICYKHFMAVFDPLGRHKKKVFFLARQDKIYRNISDALGRLRIDHKYFSICANTNTSECIAEKKRKGLVKVATTIKMFNSF